MCAAKPRAVQMRVYLAPTILSDDASCKKISSNYASSTNERFRRFANEIGGHLAPNGRIILCELPDAHRKYGSAFAFALKDDITTHAWGIALSSYLIFTSSDDELRGLIAHELGHNATGRGSCDHLRRDRYRKCEQEMDDYGASLVGSCKVLRMLEAIRRDEPNLPAESEDALRKRIFHMYALCK